MKLCKKNSTFYSFSDKIEIFEKKQTMDIQLLQTQLLENKNYELYLRCNDETIFLLEVGTHKRKPTGKKQGKKSEEIVDINKIVKKIQAQLIKYQDCFHVFDVERVLYFCSMYCDDILKNAQPLTWLDIEAAKRAKLQQKAMRTHLNGLSYHGSNRAWGLVDWYKYYFNKKIPPKGMDRKELIDQMLKKVFKQDLEQETIYGDTI